jgi:hypothetical protein
MPKIRDLGINVIPEITRPPEVGPGGGCGPTGCKAHTMQCGATVPCSANYGCAWTPIDCGGATFAQSQGCGMPAWGGGPTDHCSGYCGQYYQQQCDNSHLPCGATDRWAFVCGQGPTLQNSPGCAQNWALGCGGGTLQNSPGCAASGLSRESIAQLKEQLYKYIQQLDEYAKSIGPKTAEEIDAREKELKAELEELAKRRRDLGK